MIALCIYNLCVDRVCIKDFVFIHTGQIMLVKYTANSRESFCIFDPFFSFLYFSFILYL